MTAHLRLAPTLDQHEVTAGHLTREHRGRTVAIQFKGGVVVGALSTVVASVTTGFRVVQVVTEGQHFRLHLPHDHPVTVVPAGARLTTTLGVQQ